MHFFFATRVSKVPTCYVTSTTAILIRSKNPPDEQSRLEQLHKRLLQKSITVVDDCQCTGIQNLTESVDSYIKNQIACAAADTTITDMVVFVKDEVYFESLEKAKMQYGKKIWVVGFDAKLIPQANVCFWKILQLSKETFIEISARTLAPAEVSEFIFCDCVHAVLYSQIKQPTSLRKTKKTCLIHKER